MAERTDLTGKKIGHIRIDELIGSGGMGNVYRGFDETLKRTVAVKALRSDARLHPDLRARFLREARILSQLEHPSICRIYDLIETDETDLLILEFVDGHTFDAQRLATLSFEEKLRLAITLAEVLVTAHRAGIVHRDLKPDNLMTTHRGELKVLDFGIARRFQEQLVGSGAIDPLLEKLDADAPEDSTLVDRPMKPSSKVDFDKTFQTEHQSIVGTLAYMSPEQSRQGEVTAASDMYSFGVVLQEMFTGRRAYPQDLKFVELIVRVSEADTLPAEGLPPDLTELLQQLKDPAASQRPTASTARDRLAWIRDRPIRRRRRKRRNLLLAAISTLVLVAVGLVVHARFEAQQIAAAAQNFAQQARDVEWALRSAALGPPQDIRPLRAEARRRMDSVREEMEKLGEIVRGPGEYALGRAALALGDFEQARKHLEAALEANPSRSEVQIALGVVLMELYELELADLRRRSPPDRRAEELDALANDFLEPAREYLRAHGGEDVEDAGLLRLESSGYGKALIALSEEKFEDAQSHAESTLEDNPRLYEADSLIGRILTDRGESQVQSGAYEAARQDFDAARDAFLRAAEIGRGDPSIFAGLCALTEARVRLHVHGTGGDLDAVIREGIPSCEAALKIDPEHGETMGLLATLYFRRAEWDPKDSTEAVDQVIDLANRALEIDPEMFWVWNTLGNIHLIQADWNVFHDEDPEPHLSRANQAYQEALNLAPGSPNAWNNLGNAHSLIAIYQIQQNIDPTDATQEALDAYREALRLADGEFFSDGNAAGTASVLAGDQLRRGIDPRPTLQEGLKFTDICLQRNPNSAQCRSNRAELLTRQALWLLREKRQIEEAASLLETARPYAEKSLEIYPDNTFSIFSLALTELAFGELAEARGRNSADHRRRALEQIGRAEELDPGNIFNAAVLRAARGETSFW